MSEQITFSLTDRGDNITIRLNENARGPAGTAGTTSWSGLTGEANHIPFDTTPTSVPTTLGTLSWNAGDACLEYAVDGGTISIGKETFDYYTNLSGVTMVDGDIVSIVGATGNRTAVDLTDATDATSAANVIGMVTQGAANNGTVRVTKTGSVHSLNTNGLTEGGSIYVDPADPGKWTMTRPERPNHVVSIGVVQVAHAVNGVADVVPNHQCRTAADITDPENIVTNARVHTAIDGDFAQTPWKISGCVGAWAADSVTTSGGYVTQWTDKTGGGNHLTPNTATLAQKGLWTETGVEPYVNVGLNLTTALSLNQRDFTFVWVGRPQSTTTYGPGGILFQSGTTSGTNATLQQQAAYTYMAGPVRGGSPMPYPAEGFASVVVAGGSSAADLYVNGAKSSVTAYAAATMELTKLLGAKADGMYGTNSATYAMLAFSRKLTEPEIRQILAYYSADKKEGINLIGLGDSIMKGESLSSSSSRFAMLAANVLGMKADCNGLSGRTMATIVSLYTAGSFFRVPGGKNIHLIQAGSNDLATGTGKAAQLITDIQTMTSRIKVDDPHAQVLVCTILPRNASFSGGQNAAGFETDRQTVRTSVLANYASWGADGVVDFAGNTTIGDAADADNTTYYGDKIHPTAAGHAIMAQVLVAAIRNL